ncbi:MAG: lipid-A-disaccharide synthase, partial [Planctomycetota bacterium JB042]
LISAGEVSGEHHAARLLAALRRRDPSLEFDAFGGRHLEAAGARLLFPLSDFAVMGFKAVFEHIGTFVKVLARFDRTLREDRPDLVVLLDYPGLHVRFARLCRRRGVPVLYYVCPQLWAWAPWRARRFARVVDHALTILPFEEEYFRRLGIDARYVGHPAADELAAETAGEEDDALEAEVRGAAPGLALLPGSRPQEVRTNLPLMVKVARRIREEHPAATFFLPQLRDDTAAVCREVLEAHPLDGVRFVRAVRPVLRGARFALVVSGTVTFEVACHGVPMVVVYRLTRFQRFLADRILTVPWISQVNLIAGRELVPEFVTPDEPVEEIAAACLDRIGETETRRECVKALGEDLRHAFSPGASERAADAVLALLRASGAASGR